MKSVYIASTHGRAVKTTLSVGLCLALRRRGLCAGCFKPVGAFPVRGGNVAVDEDAAFVAEPLGPDDHPGDLCPVLLDEDALHEALTGPEVDTMGRVEEAGVSLVSVASDTVTATDSLRRLFGRLRISDRGKIDLINGIIDECVDVDRLIGDLQHD